MIVFGRTAKISRGAAVVMAAVGLCAATPVAAAYDRSSQSQITDRMSVLFRNNPGSGIIFEGCKAVAEDEYRKTSQISDGLSAITVCAGLGCTLTQDYANCASVVSELFVLRVLLEAG